MTNLLNMHDASNNSFASQINELYARGATAHGLILRAGQNTSDKTDKYRAIF